MRREYAGAARKAQLASPLGGSTLDLGIACDDLDGWPTGAGGPFWVVIGRKTPTEEKILCASRTGNSLTVYTDGLINGRGADGTTISTHGVGEYVEHVYTATDADEANEHVNSDSNVHGVVSPVVGEDDVQTLTNKTISGTANTLTNIPQSGVTGLVSKLADLDAEDVDLQNQINTKAPSNNPTFTGNVVLPSTTTIGDVSSTELGYVDGATSNIQAQLNSKAPTESPIFSGTPILPSTTLIGGVTINEITGGGLAVPPGGAEDEILVKLSNADYDMAWKPLSYLMYIPGTGTGDEIVADGQIIGGVKTSWTDTNTGYVYNIHTFDYNPAYEWGVATDGLNCLSPVRGLLLVVAGGGAGGNSGTFSYGGGGGGGGGVFYGAYAFGTGIHNLIVGRGGQSVSANGGVSRFDDLIIPGGGGGGNSGGPGAAGGSGGGGSGNTGGAVPGGAVTLGTGYSADFHYGNPGGGGDVGFSGAGGSSGLSTAIFDSGALTTYAAGGAGRSGAGDAANGRGNGGNGAGPNIGSASNYGKGGNGCIKVRYRIA